MSRICVCRLQDFVRDPVRAAFGNCLLLSHDVIWPQPREVAGDGARRSLLVLHVARRARAQALQLNGESPGVRRPDRAVFLD